MKKPINFQITRHICTTAILALSLFSSVGYADSLMASGQWKDPNTGLIWMRCSIGQEWNGSTCTGQAIIMNWADANEYPRLFNQQVAFGGKSNWRLPNIAELSTLRYCSNGWARENSKTVGNLTQSSGPIVKREIPNGRGGYENVPNYCETGTQSPSINRRLFPNTVDDFYWSSSPFANDNDAAWCVGFYNGNDAVDSKNSSRYVRLVRGGQ